VRLYFFLLALPLLDGCGTIYSVEPFGNEIAVLDPKKVDGVWLASTGQLIGARVVDAKNGVLTTWLVKTSQISKDQIPLRCEPPSVSEPTCTFKNQVGTCLFSDDSRTCIDHAVATCSWRRYDTGYFPVIRDAKKDAYATRFGLGLFGYEKKAVASAKWPYALVFGVTKGSPGAERVRKLIQEGKLPRNLDDPKAPILGPLSEKHYQMIFNASSVDLNPFSFWTTSATSLTKLPDDIDPCKKGGVDK